MPLHAHSMVGFVSHESAPKPTNVPWAKPNDTPRPVGPTFALWNSEKHPTKRLFIYGVYPLGFKHSLLENTMDRWERIGSKLPDETPETAEVPSAEGRILRRSGRLFQQSSGAAPEGVTLTGRKVVGISWGKTTKTIETS